MQTHRSSLPMPARHITALRRIRRSAWLAILCCLPFHLTDAIAGTGSLPIAASSSNPECH